MVVPSAEGCGFYHVMDIPGHGVVGGLWDLRDRVDEYLGHFAFGGKRVLEIGPASGFLTFEMEKRGADVVAVEITDEHGWDFVPYPDSVLEPKIEPRRKVITALKRAFWFAHAAYHSRAQAYYGDPYDLPEELGQFDVAVMAAVLLHTRGPLQLIQQCAKRASALVITDLFYPDLEGQPICRLHPTAENKRWDTWWHFSTDFFLQYLAVLGFTHFRTTTHLQIQPETPSTPSTFFTIVASRG
jgi:SAM-dependent methyltransferase